MIVSEYLLELLLQLGDRLRRLRRLLLLGGETNHREECDENNRDESPGDARRGFKVVARMFA